MNYFRREDVEIINGAPARVPNRDVFVIINNRGVSDEALVLGENILAEVYIFLIIKREFKRFKTGP